ncbi:MAG: bile acid:sodium symporter family protein [Candidatus Omnitrophica bacterium]|nr:bile acid:sodium symporter family protein [Candidatus Omnitrophota bacterium]
MNKIFEKFTQLLVVWTVLAVVIGYLYPPVLTVFRAYLDYMFMFTMLGIGFVLNPEDFLPVIKKPWLPLLGTFTQFLIMPLSAFCIAKALRLPPSLALGLIVAGSVPGAMASNVISYLAKADVALSIAITTVSTFLAPVLTPFFTYFLARTYMHVDFWAMFKSILMMVVVPLAVGLTMKHHMREKIERIRSFFPALSTLFIAFICGLIVALNKDKLAHLTPMIFAAVVILNIAGLLGGYGLGRVYRFNEQRRRTLAIEVGMQNAGLGAVLAIKHFSAEAALPSAIFATWCVITASVLAGIWWNKPGGISL